MNSPPRPRQPPTEISDLQRLRAALEAVERSGWRSPSGCASALQIGFESWLERDYLRYRSETNLLLRRLAVALGVLFYSIYIAHDWLGSQHYTNQPLLFWLMLFVAPSNALLVACSFRRGAWRYIQSVALLVAVANTVGMVVVSVVGARNGLHAPHELLLIQLFYDFFLLGLPWVQATVLALLTALAAPFALWLAGSRGIDLFDYGFFLAVAAVLGAIACYLQERAQRLAWLRQQLLRQLSEHDPLTGICNHRAWYERCDAILRQAQREQQPVAVLAVDVDHFKQFNDRHGHLAGDDCLRRVAQALAGFARRPLDVVGRLGGEEFALFLYGVDAATAEQHAEAVRLAIRTLQPLPEVRVTTSVGVASAMASQLSSTETLVARADTALYRAKTSGRDRVCLWSEAEPPA